MTKRNLVILWPALAAAVLCLLSCWNNIPPFVWEYAAQGAGKVLTGDEVTVTARANDPEGDSASLRISWGDGDTSPWSAASDEHYAATFTHRYAVGGRFPVRVQGRDASGRRSDWLGNIDQKVFDTAQVRWIVGVLPYDEHACPAIGADGTIYIATGYGLRAIYPDSTTYWTTANYGGTQPVIGADGTTIYAASAYTLGAFRPDGTVIWDDSIGSSGIRFTPAVGPDGTVYVCSYDSLIALNPDGTRKWAYGDTTGSRPESSPAVGADGTVYIVWHTQNDYLLALNPTGEAKWTFNQDYPFGTELAIAGDGTIYAWGGSYIWAVNPDGTQKWKGAGDYVTKLVIGPDGTAYTLAQDGRRLVTWTANGSDGWSYDTHTEWTGHMPGTPALAENGVICFSSGDDTLRFINPDGSLLSAFECDAPVTGSPTIAPDGTIYVTAEDGYLYAIKGSVPLASGGWPKYQCNAGNSGRAGSAAHRERSSR